MAKAPDNLPAAMLAKSTIRLEIPPAAIRLPARIKKGTAIRGKESVPPNMRCGTRSRFCPCDKKANTVAKPRLAAIGVPAISKTTSETNKIVSLPDRF